MCGNIAPAPNKKYSSISEAVGDLNTFVWDLDKVKKDLDFKTTKYFEFNCGQEYKVTIERIK